MRQHHYTEPARGVAALDPPPSARLLAVVADGPDIPAKNLCEGSLSETTFCAAAHVLKNRSPPLYNRVKTELIKRKSQHSSVTPTGGLARFSRPRTTTVAES